MTAKRPARTASERHLTNSVGLSAKELIKLFNELDELATTRVSPLRNHARWPFRAMALPVEVYTGNGNSTKHLLACRNLSSTGAGFVHNAYMHSGLACAVTMPRLHGNPARVTGTIARCQHRRGVIHEIGIQFSESIDMREFVATDPLAGLFTPENINPDELQGTLLHVEPVDADRAMVRNMVRDTLLRIKTAETAEEGLALAKEGADVILYNFDLPDMPGEEFLAQLTEHSNALILISAGNRTETIKTAASKTNVVGFITKPLNAQLVRAGIAEAMERAKSVGENGGDDELRRSVLKGLKAAATDLDAALAATDVSKTISACLQLKGFAPAVGLVDIGQLAELIVTTASQTQTMELVAEQVEELAELCRAASSDPQTATS